MLILSHLSGILCQRELQFSNRDGVVEFVENNLCLIQVRNTNIIDFAFIIFGTSRLMS